VDVVRRFAEPAERVWIVFDGPRPSPPPDDAAARERVQVVFAASADDWIVKRVRSSEAPERLAVVTGDRQVAGRARHRGARIETPREFIAKCVPPDVPD
jgi:predicted RNA-binding protein with PIN domain